MVIFFHLSLASYHLIVFAYDEREREGGGGGGGNGDCQTKKKTEKTDSVRIL